MGSEDDATSGNDFTGPFMGPGSARSSHRLVTSISESRMLVRFVTYVVVDL